MEHAELISLLENLLGPAATGVPPTQGPPGGVPLVESPTYEAGDGRFVEEVHSAPSASMTGLLSAIMPIGIAILDAATLQIVRANSMLLRMLERPERPEQVIGQRIDHVVRALAQPQIALAFSQVVATGIVFSDVIEDTLSSAGAEPVYRRCTLSPLRKGSGRFELVLLTVLDVTEQVRSQRLLQQALDDAEQRARVAESGVYAKQTEAMAQREDRMRVAAEQASRTVERLRLMEEQLRQVTDQKRQIEEAARRKYDELLARFEQAQRTADELRRAPDIAPPATAPVAPDSARASGVLVMVTRELTSAAPLVTTLGKVATLVGEGLGDTCAIFLQNTEGAFVLAAIHHRDPLVASQLRAHYAEHPLRPGEGVVGEILAGGASRALDRPTPAEVERLLPGYGARAQSLGLVSGACVALGKGEPLGALLLLSTLGAKGGSERRLTAETLGELEQIASPIALAARNERLRHDLELAQALQDAVFRQTSEGVAMYDHLGRLRVINAVGERLLSPPRQPGAPRPQLQGFLARDGRWLTTENLPWMRATRGDLNGLAEYTPIEVAWEGGLRRSLLIKVTLVQDVIGNRAFAAVLLKPAEEEAPQPVAPPHATREPRYSLPPDLRPASESLPLRAALSEPGMPDLGEVCALVARAQGGVLRRRFEVRLPNRPVPIAADEAHVEHLVSQFLGAASQGFRAGVPLQISVMVETPRRPSGGQRAAGASSAIDERGRRQEAVATIQVMGPRAGAEIEDATPLLDEAHTLASALHGSAWLYDDGSYELSFLLRLPVAA